MADSKETNGGNRRNFFTAMVAIFAGAVALLTPLMAGVVSFLSPLFKRADSTKVRVALLSQVPDDGLPRYFPVVTDREDAWNRYPNQRVGAVYLVREEGEEVPLALTAKCPHAGCFIDFAAADNRFRCPCHTSNFELDGTRERGDAEVSPRDMDRLPVELRAIADAGDADVTEVWVEFIDFQTGHSEAIPSV